MFPPASTASPVGSLAGATTVTPGCLWTLPGATPRMVGVVKNTEVSGAGMTVHVRPSPVKPGLQVHAIWPVSTVQAASAWQPPLFTSHPAFLRTSRSGDTASIGPGPVTTGCDATG